MWLEVVDFSRVDASLLELNKEWKSFISHDHHHGNQGIASKLNKEGMQPFMYVYFVLAYEQILHQYVK